MVYVDKTSPVFPWSMSIDSKTLPLFSSTKAERRQEAAEEKVEVSRGWFVLVREMV